MILSRQPPINIKQEKERPKDELLPRENTKQEETNRRTKDDDEC